MDEVLKLQPGELWVWTYLCDLANRQESSKVTVPRIRESRWLREVYSAKQFLRHLLSLESKNFLLVLHRPKNQAGQIIVHLVDRLRLDMYVQADGRLCPGGGGNGGSEKPTWTPMSKRGDQGNGGGSKAGPERPDMGGQAETQLSLSLRVFKESFKAWMDLGQKDLLQEVIRLSGEELEKMEMRVYRIAPRAKAKKRSRAARLFAALRFIQDGNRQARNAQAWVESVARRADIEQERLWSEGSSGSGGRSQFPGESGRRATSSSGKI